MELYKGIDMVERVKRGLLSMQRHSWEQGVAMQAFLESGDTDIVCSMAREAVYRSMEDGRVASIGVTDAVTDPCSAGEALLWCKENTADKELAKGCGRLLHWALYRAPRNAQGVCYHLTDRKEFWVDSMYMLPPFLAAAGYYEEALLNCNGYFEALFDKNYMLMCHQWNDENKIFVRAKHWGVGNGWALSGLARMIDLLPPSFKKEREELVQKAGMLLGSVLKYRRGDGLFHDIIDETNSFVETNLSQMLAYTIYRGVHSGWLPREYIKEAEACRDAVWDKVDRYGMVQGVCGAPAFDKAGISPEGNAFFILMEAARKLVS